MTTKDSTWWLLWNGLSPVQIAGRVGVSRQRVGEILSASPARRAGKPGRPIRIEPDLEWDVSDLPPGGKREGLSGQQRRRMREILRSRNSWAWWEADQALKAEGIIAAAISITPTLRELGFKHDRGRKRWVRSKTS